MLLPCVRLATRRWLPRTMRGVGTVPTRDDATFKLSLAMLGEATAKHPDLLETDFLPSLARDIENMGLENMTLPPPVPVPAPVVPTVSTIMNIPPAEDPLLHYLTSHLMRHGHRARAARIVSNILLYIHSWTRAPPLPILRKAIIDAAPAVRTLSHRAGGKTLFKPSALSEQKRIFFALKHIKDASRGKPGRTVEERMAREMLNIVEGLDSEAVKTKLKMHEFATVNRGNAQSRI